MAVKWNVSSTNRCNRSRHELLVLSTLALAVASAMPGHARAANYTVSNQAELVAAINAANAGSDPSSTIQLSGDLALTSATMLPTPNNPLTIDTQGFTFTGVGAGNGIVFSSGGGTLTIAGTLYGGDGTNVAGAASNGGGGLGVNRGSTNLVNNGTITGGNGGHASTGNYGGVGVAQGAGSFTNNGTVIGGIGDGGLPNGVGATLIGGGTITNHGTIEGGAGRTGTGGIGLQFSSGGGTLNNDGIIMGGESLGGTATGGYGVYASATGASVINNTGMIEGGSGAAAIHGVSSLNIVNSGTISAGAGQTNAIQLGSATRTITLQLQAGSTINGNVVGGTTANDTLILGGGSDATFDISAVGSTAQYQNFDIFQKTGTSTWSLVGTGTASTPWIIQQGTLQLGNGGTSGSFVGDVTNNGALAFNRSNLLTFANVISGSGSVSQVGTGETVLTGANTYTGGTTISAGSLRITSDGNLGDVTGGLTFTGGTLATGADIASARTVALNGTGTLSTDAGTTFTLGGVVSGNGGLTKVGGGTLVLAGTNTYAGGTSIDGGEVRIASDANLGASAGALSFAGGTLHTTADIAMNRAVALGGTATFLTDAGTTLTQSGLVAGNGALVKTGNGTLVLAGNDSYGGGTTIAAGILQVGNGGASGSVVGNVTNNGAIAFDRSDTAAFAGVVSGTGMLAQNGNGTTVLTGANTYTGGTTIGGGTLQLGDGGTGGSIVGNVANGGALVFNRSDEVDFAGVISGSGDVVQAGTGNTVFDGAQTYTGATSVEAGRLSINGSITSAVAVHAAGTLGGTGTIFGDVTNIGTVAPGNSIGTLTVAGNYVGQGGTLAIEAALGDDSSATDRLVVTGDTSGTTHVKVTNVGGSGALTVQGIQIVDVRGASNGNFNLVGDYLYQGQPAVVGGAYAYRLYKNGLSTPGDGDWYLRSQVIESTAGTPPVTPVTSPLYAPNVPLYEVYAGVLQRLNQLGTLQQRAGSPDFNADDSSASNDARPGAGWVRVHTDHADFSPETSIAGADYAVTTQKLQVGVDGLLHEGNNGVLVAGITAQSGKATSNVQSSTFGEGRIKATGYGIGGTLTWYGAGGFYVDAQAQWNRYRSDIDSYTLARQLANGNHGSGYDLGVEAGQKFALNDEWSLIPQGQLTYSSVRFDGFVDPYGADVSRRDGDSLEARAGLAVDHLSAWPSESGMNRAHVYGIGNLYYDFMGGTKADVSGLTLNSKNAPLWGGLGIGGSLAWKDGRYRLFGETLAQTSLQHFGDSTSYSLRVGFNMRW